jgi:acetyltransferase
MSSYHLEQLLLPRSVAIVGASPRPTSAGRAVLRNLRAAGFAGPGDSIDVDFADLLDFFALDRATRAILLYVESIKDARKFMSAARAAARAKPVVVVKSGRHRQGAKAAQTHTGALAGSDAVYDAAFRRAGLLRVIDLDELFAAAETLDRLRPFTGKRLAILINGGGVGVLAVDRLIDLGGTLADISPGTMQRLDAALPPIWSRANPVDIAGDADAARYTAAFEALLEDPGNDAILVMNVPTALGSAADAAKSVVAALARHRARFVPGKPALAVWVGGSADAAATFEAAGIPDYVTESEAVGGFMHLVRYRDAQDALMATPPNLPADFVPDTAAARRRRCRGRPRLAQPGRGNPSPRRLFDTGRPCPPRPRSGRSRRRRGTAPRRRIDRGGQDSVARYRAQVRHRRRASQFD